MKILADKAMPYWEEFFIPLGKVKTFVAGELTESACLSNANPELQAYLPEVEYLLVRSTTKINKALLDRMPNVKFVATATAGYDHFDIELLNARNIKWYAAGGCNAQAVAQYVVCALLHIAENDGFLIKDKTVAVVGHGNVGSRVANAMRALGADVLIYDPPQKESVEATTSNDTTKNAITLRYASFDDVLKADIICLHTPLNSHAKHPSYHLFDTHTIAQLNASQYLLNAGRGEVIDNSALLARFIKDEDATTQALNVVLDVWEHEPTINKALIPYLRLVSAHIAGHTLEGKARGTSMIYQQLCSLNESEETLSLESLLPPCDILLPGKILLALRSAQSNSENETQGILKEICHLLYDIQNDDRVFRHHMAQSDSFAKIRQEYPIRREFTALTLSVSNIKIKELLHGIGFIISNDSTTS